MSFVLTFDMPLKRSCYRNIMKGVVFCTVLHTFWYSQDKWTVCLLIFKNKYYKGKQSVDSGLFIALNLTIQLWCWHFLLKFLWKSFNASIWDNTLQNKWLDKMTFNQVNTATGSLTDTNSNRIWSRKKVLII